MTHYSFEFLMKLDTNQHLLVQNRYSNTTIREKRLRTFTSHTHFLLKQIQPEETGSFLKAASI